LENGRKDSKVPETSYSPLLLLFYTVFGQPILGIFVYVEGDVTVSKAGVDLLQADVHNAADVLHRSELHIGTLTYPFRTTTNPRASRTTRTCLYVLLARHTSRERRLNVMMLSRRLMNSGA
jgi:hypothetical protein